MSNTNICYRFLAGRCPFSNLTCPLSHNKDNVPLCRNWRNGQCIGTTGNSCKFRHYYTERDGALAQASRNMDRLVRGNISSVESYSSPYRVKVVKEVSKQRREEVDLETGKRKSWIETKEFEVLDLTGETPVKKALPLIKSPLGDANNKLTVTAGNKSELRKKNSPLPLNHENDPGTCPMCLKKFKGEKGVKAHRRAKNSACHPSKEKENAQSTPPSTNNLQSKTSGSSDSANSSIIIIPDTPTQGSRRSSLRRSIRLI